jgi:DNA-directed RNA polymerase subunit H (RpoH/RPB5)
MQKVSEKQPRLVGAPGPGALASAEQEITKAVHEERVAPLIALNDCLDALEIASRELHRDSSSTVAQRDYNFAVGRVIEIIRKAKLAPWTAPLTVPGPHGDFVLAHKPDPRPGWNPALYEFTPADRFDVHGKFVTERTTRNGIGAPIVAVEREINQNARQNFAPSRVFYSITAVAHFEGHRAQA